MKVLFCSYWLNLDGNCMWIDVSIVISFNRSLPYAPISFVTFIQEENMKVQEKSVYEFKRMLEKTNSMRWVLVTRKAPISVNLIVDWDWMPFTPSSCFRSTTEMKVFSLLPHQAVRNHGNVAFSLEDRNSTAESERNCSIRRIDGCWHVMLPMTRDQTTVNYANEIAERFSIKSCILKLLICSSCMNMCDWKIHLVILAATSMGKALRQGSSGFPVPMPSNSHVVTFSAQEWNTILFRNSTPCWTCSTQCQILQQDCCLHPTSGFIRHEKEREKEDQFVFIHTFMAIS